MHTLAYVLYLTPSSLGSIDTMLAACDNSVKNSLLLGKQQRCTNQQTFFEDMIRGATAGISPL